MKTTWHERALMGACTGWGVGGVAMPFIGLGWLSAAVLVFAIIAGIFMAVFRVPPFPWMLQERAR
jgi:hypothetical protein